jgi:hypothetical protein
MAKLLNWRRNGVKRKNGDTFFITNQYYSPVNPVGADFNPECIVQWDTVIFRY